MIKYLALFTFIFLSISTAKIESIFIEGVQFSPKDDGYNVVVYSSIDPFVIMAERFVSKDRIDFLKGCKPPIWITFKDNKVTTIITDGKRMRGENLKDTERDKILQFRNSLEEPNEPKTR